MIELNTNIEELSTRAVEWNVKENQDISTKLVQDLDFAMDDHPELAFLVAQEVGHTERAIDVRFSDDTHIFMNPIFKTSDRIALSREYDRITKKEYIVPRFSNIELIFQDCLGGVKAIKLEGIAAMVVSQAMDMLDGVYPNDLGLEIIPEFDEASPEEQQEIINEYLNNYIKNAYKALDEDLSNNESIKEEWNAIKFMAAKSKGDVEIDNSKDESNLSNRKKKYINKLVKKLKNNENKLKFWRKK